MNTYQAAAYYAEVWSAIPILLHYVKEWRSVWDPDLHQNIHKPVCSCHRGIDCSNPAKHPIRGPKQVDMSTPRAGLTAAHWIFQQYPQAQLALRTGPESGIFCVDVDIRPDKRGDLAILDGCSRIGLHAEAITAATLVQHTGGGGVHYVFRYPKGRKIPSVTNHPAFGPGVDIKGDGGQFNVWPSLHKSGNQYFFPALQTIPLEHIPTLIAEPPDLLVEAIEKRDYDPFAEQSRELEAYTPTVDDINDLGQRLKNQRKNPRLREIGKNLQRAMASEMLFEEGGAHDGFRDIAFRLALEWPYFDVDQVLELFREAFDRRQREKPDASTDLANFRDSLITAKQKAEQSHKSWTSKLKRNSIGEIEASPANLLNVFENDVSFRENLYYDVRLKLPALRKPVENFDLPDPQYFPRHLEGGDTMRLARWIETKYGTVIHRPKDCFECLCIAGENMQSVDPFKDWIENLPPWDGVLRLETLMQYVAATPDSDYARIVMPIWFRGFVRRILQPGFKVDTMLILEGSQGLRKSTFFRSLVPFPELFSDSVPKLSNHEQQPMRTLHSGPALWEVSDLAAFSRSKLNELKAALSATDDLVRPLWQADRRRDRNFIFVGTTNEKTYLKDPTGGRRFLPVEVHRLIDIDYVVSVREQLFAEAVIGLKQGLLDHWTFDLYHRFFHVVEARRDSDDLEERLREILDKPVEVPDAPGRFVYRTEIRVKDILSDIYDETNAPISRREQMRVATCLRALGWEKYHTDAGKVWRRHLTT